MWAFPEKQQTPSMGNRHQLQLRAAHVPIDIKNSCVSPRVPAGQTPALLHSMYFSEQCLQRHFCPLLQKFLFKKKKKNVNVTGICTYLRGSSVRNLGGLAGWTPRGLAHADPDGFPFVGITPSSSLMVLKVQGKSDNVHSIHRNYFCLFSIHLRTNNTPNTFKSFHIHFWHNLECTYF